MQFHTKEHAPSKLVSLKQVGQTVVVEVDGIRVFVLTGLAGEGDAPLQVCAAASSFGKRVYVNSECAIEHGNGNIIPARVED